MRKGDGFVVLAVMYFAIFMLCWILSLIVIKHECETDGDILNSRIKLLEVMLCDYKKSDKYNLIYAVTTDTDIVIRDELKLYEDEVRQRMGNIVRVEVETKFEGSFIISPYLSLRRILPKKINKNYWY